MSAATCGVTVVAADPGYRFAHPGYNLPGRGGVESEAPCTILCAARYECSPSPASRGWTRLVGWVERSETHRNATANRDGVRVAPSILPFFCPPPPPPPPT